jgi:hypothetical protein
MNDEPARAGELKASVTTGSFNPAEVLPDPQLKQPIPQTVEPKGVKARVLSISVQYITLEVKHSHNLQQGQAVTVHAD